MKLLTRHATAKPSHYDQEAESYDAFGENHSKPTNRAIFSRVKATYLVFLLILNSFDASASISKAVRALSADIKNHPEWNFHSLLVSQDGQLVFEEYYNGSDEKWGNSLGQVSFTRETVHDLRSVTKSIVSTLVGIAIHEGKIKSIDQPIQEFFPDRKFADKKSEITLRHALTMSMGLQWDEMSTSYTDPKNDSSLILLAPDPVAFILDRPLFSPPGKIFNYCGGSTEVVAEVLQRATKTPLRKYFEDKLWLPLGGQVGNEHGTSYEWGGRKNGLPAAEFGLRLSPRDLMKFATLFVRQGKHERKQIVPAGWIAEATRNQIKDFPELLSKRFAGYGYQWWLPKLKGAENAGVFAALGNGGQTAYIFPKQRLIFVTTAGFYNKPGTTIPMLLEKHVVPVLGK